MTILRRSALYLPASNIRAIAKARRLDADVLILDLEDAVSPDMKAIAREHALAALNEGEWCSRERVIRVNALDTEWGSDDFALVGGMDVDAVLLPKISSAEQVSAAAAALPEGTKIWAMIETPLAILRIAEIAAASEHLPLTGFVVGTNDLAKDARIELDLDRSGLLGALGLIVLAARAYGLVVLDGVFNSIDDLEGLAKQCRQSRALGFDGKTLIHPVQIEPCHRAFVPDPEAVAEAIALIAMFDAKENQGKGAIRFNGRMVERLHMVDAQRILADAKAAGQLSI